MNVRNQANTLSHDSYETGALGEQTQACPVSHGNTALGVNQKLSF